MFTEKDHTFAVCAYKSSPYLEECIRSLMAQSVKTNVCMYTSTPNDYIFSLGEKYGIPVFINEGPSGIGGDWNFAYDHTETPLVTLAHQDDIYEPNYAKEMLAFLNRAKDPIMYFCGYGELRDGLKVYNNKILNIKKLMLFPVQPKLFWHSRFLRRLVLSFGNPICCPSVTMVKGTFGETPFISKFDAALDWEQWEIQSRKNGSFIYNPHPLMCHRIHEESATSAIINDNKRSAEEYEIYRLFWPDFIAKLLTKAYSESQNSNQL